MNKWENENSYPDIALLAPIARLLGISLDTLLSFQEELTIETYPNCLMLIWQLAVILNAQRVLKGIPNAANYDDYILGCYNRVLDSSDETLRTNAADSLFGYYLRNEPFETAEKYLQYYSMQNPQRKLKQGIVYSKTGQTEKAYKLYEEILFSGYQILSTTLNSLCLLSLQEKNSAKAHLFADKQQILANLFEMGKYYEAAFKLDLATAERDVDTILDTMETLLDSINDITGFSNSSMYEHMDFQKSDCTLTEQLKQELLNCFREKNTYGFLEGNERWQRIIQQ